MKLEKKLVAEAMLLFPKATTVKLPAKDPNQCIMDGVGQAAYKAMAFNSAPPKNTRIIIANEELHDEWSAPVEYGELSWPYPSMNRYLRKMRKGETIFIGAGVKMGKSELLNDIAGHLIKEHGSKVFMAKPEEANKKTYRLMCNKMMGQVFHDPDVSYDEEDYNKAGEMLRDKLMMVDLYQHLGWETLKSDIISAAHLGAEAIFIDPITNLTNGMTSADANVKLQEIAQELAALAMDLNVVIFIFCHLKAPDGNMSK